MTVQPHRVQILSVDLANASYRNLGIVLLEVEGADVNVQRLAASDLGLTGAPCAAHLAEALDIACQRLDVSVLLLDGSQGWKDPHNGLLHSRLCERALNTPGKTGLPGVTKPGSYLGFLSFSVDVFQQLTNAGFVLFKGDSGERLLVESFPTSAWRQLGILPLPSKARSRPADLARAARELGDVFPARVPEGLTHDELQALVVAFAGVALATRAPGLRRF